MWHAIWSLPSWFIGALGLLLVGAVLLGRWGVKAILEDRRIDAEPDPLEWRKEREAEGPGTRPLRVTGSSGWRGRFDSDSPQLRSDLPGPGSTDSSAHWAGEHHTAWHERLWWDDPDLTVWDARQAALRCWEIVHIEFPRLRAELGIAA